MNCRYLTLSGAMGVAALLYGPSPALAQGYLGVNLTPFAVLADTTVTCTGASIITGLVGISAGTLADITGFPVPCTGTVVASPASDPGKADLLIAYGTLDALGCSSTVGPDLTGLALVPGIYCVTSGTSNLTGTLTLDALGNPDAVWVFQMVSDLITSPDSVVDVIGGGNDCGVQWLVRSSATIDTNTTFVGNILALTSIALQTGANLTGRALARNGAVTLAANNVSFATCVGSAPPPFGGGGVPALPHGMEWALLVILVGMGAYILSRH